MFARLLTIAAISPIVAFATTLAPNPPVPFSFFNAVGSSVTVAGNSSGYMSIWECTNSNSTLWNFSDDNGATWTPPTYLSVTNHTEVAPWIAANETGFLIVWCDLPPGRRAGILVSTFSSDNGATWSDPVSIIDGEANVNGPATVVATDSGFLVTWWQTDNSIQSSFSSNGTSWTSAVTIDLDDTDSPQAVPVATSVGDTFMVTWSTILGNGYSSFSSDQGSHWTEKSTITNDIPNGQLIWPAQTSDGFMAVWQNGFGNAYSSFSSNNGASWGTANLITSGINTGYDPIAVIGTENGFIVTAHFSNNTGQVSISSDFGQTWNPFVPFTGSYLMNNSIYNCFADITCGADGCMITWPDADSNAISAFIPISSILPIPYLTGGTQFNQFPFQSQYYNTLSWQPSPSENIVGYHIYKNGTLLASTPTLSFIDQDVNKNSTYTYEVIAYNNLGTPSSGVSTTITTP